MAAKSRISPWNEKIFQVFIPYANNKGVDQPISIFFIHSIDSIIHVPIKATPKTSRFYPLSVAEQVPFI